MPSGPQGSDHGPPSSLDSCLCCRAAPIASVSWICKGAKWLPKFSDKNGKRAMRFNPIHKTVPNREQISWGKNCYFSWEVLFLPLLRRGLRFKPVSVWWERLKLKAGLRHIAPFLSEKLGRAPMLCKGLPADTSLWRYSVGQGWAAKLPVWDFRIRLYASSKLSHNTSAVMQVRKQVALCTWRVSSGAFSTM